VQLTERKDDHERANEALITLSSPNCLVETANWLSIGRTRSESSFPVRTSSGTLATLVKKKRLEQLRDDLVRADEQDHLPFRPVADLVDLPEDDTEEENLAAKPKHLHDHPEDEIGLETHLADERVAQHDRVNFEVASHSFL
jgi:hypothetical protein